MKVFDKARHLRQQSTDAEALLWQYLRNRRLSGHKFRRQYPIGEYITDFACIAAGVIVELDGNHHAESEQRAYDDVRTLFLQTAGFRILRFWNHDVLDNLNDTLKAIEQTLSSPSPARRERGLGGEGSSP
ncbi:MAG: DNA-cytosine methyltransferase [Thiothrix lacustris]|uniref:DNA-cytosine methyltransferase n=1 Tax=Thiothrix lacustris TaxID=525917 RepID=A0A1Y1QF63_9GAMM|nr:MAG: DNA-cytosine methyltransferase [Thiothrix lacustris]